ncbi:hypothetical protein CALVIDRAFT_590650 [Calocera viscosa TUFC12733]|uniref:Uncharacterized protein n=1 Tax=Calocera viscosa (strain TUFC12733) TaxID=1330018 RepID=A0A167GIT0_CALVF|nr:hypothetical protein CALVIDRAFT_590650 [Calocera viscosa TUFC12733]
MSICSSPSDYASPAFTAPSSPSSPSSPLDKLEKELDIVKKAIDIRNALKKDTRDSKAALSPISTLDLGEKKEKGKGKLAREDTAEGCGEKDIPELVVSAGKLAMIQNLIATMQKGDGLQLTAQEVEELLAVKDKIDNDDEPERALAAPEDLPAAEGQAQATASAAPKVDKPDFDDLEWLLTQRGPQVDLDKADSIEFAGEKVRVRAVGMGVGYALQQEAYADYDAQCAEGRRIARLAELDDEYEHGRKTGKLMSKLLRVKASWKERRGQWKGQFHYRTSKAKDWIVDTAKDTVWPSVKKYGPIVIKAVGILAICAALKYLGFEVFLRFVNMILSPWFGSNSHDSE